MTYQRNMLADYHELEQPEKVGLRDGSTADAIGVGKVYIQVKSIEIVLLVSELAGSLFSVRAATSHGHSVKFSKTRCWIRNYKRKLCTSNSEGKLYNLGCTTRSVKQTSLASLEVCQKIFHILLLSPYTMTLNNS